jgi:hypothetical protein
VADVLVRVHDCMWADVIGWSDHKSQLGARDACIEAQVLLTNHHTVEGMMTRIMYNKARLALFGYSSVMGENIVEKSLSIHK